MESCHSVQYISPCHLPAHSTLGHLIKIIEKLQNRDYAVPDISDDLRWLKCERGRDKMEGSGGTGQSKQLSSVIGTLEMELRKLQQSNESLAQENTSQHQSIKALEQKLKPLNEKNRKFLEKNMELTNMNRNLKDQLQSMSEENKKLKDQCDQCRKKMKQLSQQLSQERLEKATLELQAQTLQGLKQTCADQEKELGALKLSVKEKDRRIELVQHRKRKKKVLRPLEKGVKETFYGYDEEDTSIGSDISLSLSAGTISDEELCEELSRSEMEKNYQKLMKEHMELQRLHALLTAKSGTYHDPQRELKLRVDLETNLFESQREIERLTADLTDTQKKLTILENGRSETLRDNHRLNKKVKLLEENCCHLREKLEESKEMVETLEFQVMEYETDESQDIQPNPTTATPPDSEGSTYIDMDNQSCPQQVSANEPPSVATSLPTNNTVNNAVNNAMYHNQVMANTFMNQNQMCYGYQGSQMNNYSNSPMMPFQPQTYNWQQNQFYNTPEVNRWPQDQDRYGSNYHFAHETTCSTPVSNNSSYDKENPACRQIFPVEEMQQTKKNCKECDKVKEELQKANKRIRELEKELLAASTNKTSTGDSSTYKVQTDGRPRAGVLSSGVAAANHNVGDLETIPEDPVEMNGAGHASRKGSTSNEFDVYVESLESSVRDLQSKVSSLQQENAALKERPMVASPSLEEREAQEVMTLKDTCTPSLHSQQLTTQSSNSRSLDSPDFHENQLGVKSLDESTQNLEMMIPKYQPSAGDICDPTHTNEMSASQNDQVSKGETSCLSEKIEPQNEHCNVENLSKVDESESVISEDSYASLDESHDAHQDLSHDVTACTAEIEALKDDLNKSREEVLSLRSRLEEGMSMKADELDESVDSYESKLEEFRQVCMTLQDRIFQSETSEKQLREKLKLAEYTINDLESSENSARENLEICRKSEMNCKKSLSSCQQKIRELKEIILDKDVSEMNLAEKVQYLEKAEEIASQKISDLEMQNQLLEQRLQLKEELETDIMLVETLKEQIKDLKAENKDLSAKVADLEENEEILKINWMKVAENDAERIQSLEEKVNNLESLNVDLRKRLREQREKSDPPNTPSLASELSESDTSLDRNSMVSLKEEIRKLKEELHETEEKKNGQIEKLQDRIATLRENEIKLSETLAEMEQIERELKSKVTMYEQFSSYDKIQQYEGKIQEMHRSREDLLDRMDSMEEHEGDLKKRLIEMEEKHAWKVDQYERKMELMEKEIAQYIQQEEELTNRIMEIEKHEDEVMEKANKYEEEIKLLEQQLEEANKYEEDVKLLEQQLEESESARQDLEHKGDKLLEELEELRKENQELHDNLESVNEELEQIRVENNDLNERLIELDSYEQECEEKVTAVENKSSLLEDANCRLMDRVTELEGLEMDLRSKLVSSSVNVKSGWDSCSCEEKSTDTDDLNAPTGRKLTGMFERLQDLESENQTFADQLCSLQGADSLNKKLNEKVKLLEDSEEKLMERVIELEDREDILTKENQKLRNSIMLTEVPDIVKEVTELRETIEMLKENLESLRCENEEYQEKIAVAEETIQNLQSELSIQKSTLENSETRVAELQNSLTETESDLSKEKQCVQILQDSEKNLSVKLKTEKSHAEKLECDLSKTRNEMKRMQLEYESKLSELNDTLSSHVCTVSELETSLSHLKCNEEEHSKQISELTEENNALIKLVKMKKDHVNSDCESDCENTFVQEKKLAMKFHENATPISAQSTPIKPQTNPSAKDELISDISNIVHTGDDAQCAKCIKLNQKLSEQSKRESALVENLAALRKEMQDSKEKPGRNLCSKCQGVTLSNSPSILSDVDSFFGLNKTEEFNRKVRMLEDQCDEKVLRAREKALGCRVKELEDEMEEFQRILQDIVLDVQIRFHDDIIKVGTEVPRTFQLPTELPVVLNPALGQVLENLVHCVDCLTKSKENLRSKGDEGKSKIELLEQNEQFLKQEILDLKERLANNNNGDDEIRNNPTELLTKITKLEAMNRELNNRLESDQVVQSKGGLESPEDVFRQRISELERLEKHLKTQVSDLEKDREELHEIARKDKNTIHEQNIRIRELQLSEKNMKQQLNQLEASEQGLFNKVEDLEEQIAKMEDRISELKILEMRLKELVRKYKLDEEVWLSKSANLNETLSELSMSEAQLRQQLENLEKEKLNLSEKSEYLEERLKEVEKAESSLLQRTKDQENKEISLSKRLSEMQTMGSNAEKQLADLHNANIELSQQMNHVMQENAALSHHLAQLQNQLAVLDQQNVSLHTDLERLNKEHVSLQSSGKSTDKELEKSKIREVEMEGKLRQMEESEELLKEKIGNLQRSENRLKYRIQQLESGSAVTELSPSQREKLPRKLEDCQKRIVVLQNQNEQLGNRLREYQNPESGFIKLPDAELRRLQGRDALLEQSETEVREIGKLNAHLQDTIEELREGKDVCGHESEIEALRNRLDASNRTILVLKNLIEEGQKPLGHDTNGEIFADHIMPSHMGREGKGHLAERRVKSQRSSQSNLIGRPVREPANDAGVLNEKIISKVERSEAELLVTSTGHVVMDLYKKETSHAHLHLTTEGRFIRLDGSQEVQGLHKKNPYSSTAQEDRQQRVNEFISCLERDELLSPREEAHWRQVESRVPHPPESERWIHVGKAKSLHSSVPNRSHPGSNEELVLGLTLPSESESQQFTQNDTDSSGNSPATKRRKFRPVNGTEPLMTPSSTHGAINFDAPYYLPYVNHGRGGREEEEPDVQYMTEEYKMMSPPIRTEETTGSLPDSGHGTTSVASTGRSQMSLKEKIAEIGKSLQKRPLSSVSDLSDDDEDSVHVWKSKASDSSRRLEDAEKESRYLKGEINKLEKELEEKIRYIVILEDFIEKLKALLEMKGSKSDKELVQTLEAELIKTLEELQDSGCPPQDLNQDPVALSSELAKKDRELTAKTNEVDSLMRELRQWQEECRLVEDMRTNALDALRCLEMEVSDLQTTGKDLHSSKESYSKLQQQYRKVQQELRSVELLESERDELQDQIHRLKKEVTIAAALQSEIDVSENKLDHMTSILQNRTDKIKSLIDEISSYKSRIVSLECENSYLYKTLAARPGSKARNQELEVKNEQIMVAIAPLKTKISRLVQKCRDKDDLLRRLGAELRKLKKGGGPGPLLQELAMMEQRMSSEEYNMSEAEFLQQPNHSNRLSVSMIDLQRSRSNSSVSDSQDLIAHSDTEMVTPVTRRSNQRPAERRHRLPPPTHSSHNTPHLPQIHNGQPPLSYALPSESLPVGYMPPDPLFIAVSDYSPQSIFSRSQRPGEELTLKEWDKVKVIGALDETGYYLAEVDGKTGLVPADYLRPANYADQRNGRWLGMMGEKLPSYLDGSPERIVQTHYQLQQSQRLNRNGPHFPRPMAEMTSLSQRNSTIPSRSDNPESPRDFRVEKVIDQNTLMLAWTPPKYTNNTHSRGVKCTGYKIYVDGHLHQQANSPHIAKTIVKNVDTHLYHGFSIQTVGSGGRCSDLVETSHNATVTGPRREVVEESPSGIKNNEVYSSSHKRLFVAVYDFAPSPGKHGRLELAFQAGERINVYGEERPDGFYYGEINGSRGLVPCFFIQEVPPPEHH